MLDRPWHSAILFASVSDWASVLIRALPLHPQWLLLTDKPEAITVCELGFNLGHSAATILSALDTPKKFIAFDFGEDVVEKVIGVPRSMCVSRNKRMHVDRQLKNCNGHFRTLKFNL